jgi:hypothetical protein
MKYFLSFRVVKVEKGLRFFLLNLSSYVEESHVPLKGKPSMLEAVASTTLFLCNE